MKGVTMNKKITALICAAAMLLVSGCSEQNGSNDSSVQTESSADSVDSVSKAETSDKPDNETIIDSLNNGIIIDEVSGNVYKNESNANPISPNIFCADPTAVEYNGRLYVYGTNDQQQSEEGTKNDYAHIKSLVVFSTDDMVNWIYHGRIEVGEIAPWIYNSWAPSIVSRVEDDGLTHFYLYFSNSGNGVGVITSTDPVRPWTDPLCSPLLYQHIPGPYTCPAPFPPGVSIAPPSSRLLPFPRPTAAAVGLLTTPVPTVAPLFTALLSLYLAFLSIYAPTLLPPTLLN